MVLHTTYEKLRLEVTEIARAKVMSVNPVPMDVDALRFKCKGQGKDQGSQGEGQSEQGERCPQQVPGSQGCRVLRTAARHKKSDCAQRKVDLQKAKSKGRPAVPPQAVHAVHEVGYSFCFNWR